MSILIKGMEMPNGCKECSLYGAGIHICFVVNKQVPQIGGNPPKFCPLVEVPEPHGRLIDADALSKKAYHRQTLTTVADMLNDINDAPTVIEAEEQK